LVTAVILGTARGIGETAGALTSGITSVMNTNPNERPYDFSTSAGFYLY
jgi:phosphate transport system permease protein